MPSEGQSRSRRLPGQQGQSLGAALGAKGKRRLKRFDSSAAFTLAHLCYRSSSHLLDQARAILIADETVDHEYLNITGLAEFTSSAAKLILGRDSPAIAENRVASVQTISGTGANHLGAVLLSKFYDYAKLGGGKRQIYISNPTWANHKAIFNGVGIAPIDYSYVRVSKART